jgi:NADH dehydrogenase/NADH:ubiquinone oxidoreductase subunit G
MTDIRMTIDGQEVRATEGMTVLEAVRGAGITVPSLCHHDGLQPYGGCRLCIVEAETQVGKSIVASCVHRAEDGLVIHTRSENIDRIRRSILELLLAHAPESPPLQELAREYGADASKFERETSFCVHCGLCVRYCAEIKQKHAVGFIDRGIRKEICFLPEIASTECNDCKECFPLCPTSYLQAAYVLVESLAFPGGKGKQV